MAIENISKLLDHLNHMYANSPDRPEFIRDTELIELGGQHGFPFTSTELERWRSGEVSDDELDEVAGGLFTRESDYHCHNNTGRITAVSCVEQGFLWHEGSAMFSP